MGFTEEEFNEWRGSPITEEFFKFLERESIANRKAAGLGACKSNDIQDIALAYLNLMNKAEIYEALTEIDYETLSVEDEYDY